jgi:outer membrane protein OmpA-like peptidoglycan-associated protein
VAGFGELDKCGDLLYGRALSRQGNRTREQVWTMKERPLFCFFTGAWFALILIASIPYAQAAETERANRIIDRDNPFVLGGARSFDDRAYSPALVALRIRKARDTDGDGVIDREDECPDTPAPASVDERGCPTDTDQDKVVDGIDQCAGTPRGATVDTAGCPRDSDGDGILDGLDICADTNPAALVNADGCPYDTDEDGHLDGIDQCPATPMGAVVDARGCRVDSDGDGVPDGLDKCPDTSFENATDASGCSAAQRGEFVLPTIRFRLGSTKITTGSSPALNEVASILRQNPDIIVEIGGHTDTMGQASVNRAISLNRAEEVKLYLVSQGVPASQMVTKGYGEVHPIASNRDAAGRAMNRRIEFRILPP